MTLAEAFADIESPETAARAALGSTLAIALAECTKAPGAQRLLRIVSRKSIVRRIAERTFAVLEHQPDPNFENPLDVALLLYAWLLVKANDAHALRNVLAAIIAGRNLWWSARYARLVLSGRLQGNTKAGEVTVGTPALIVGNEPASVVLVQPVAQPNAARLFTRISPSSPWQALIVEGDSTFGAEPGAIRVLSNATGGTSSTGSKP